MSAPNPAAEGGDEAGEGEEGGDEADKEEGAEGDKGTVKRVEISKPAVLPVVLDVDLFSPARAHAPPKPRHKHTKTPSMFPVAGPSNSRGREKAEVVMFRTLLSSSLGSRTSTPVERDDVMMSGAIKGGVLYGRLHERLHENNKRLREVRQLKARIKHLKTAAHRHRH